MSPRSLRLATSVGARPRVDGPADVTGSGRIVIGDDFLLVSHPARSHIYAGPRATVAIGNSVRISYGAAISAQHGLEIGHGTTLGPFVVIMDDDFHKVGDRHAAGAAAPVRIGDNVKIGARVTILRGSVIGDNATILSGSMVSGHVSRDSTVGGVPARTINRKRTTARAGVAEMADLVQRVLGLADRPGPDDGPAQIEAWDSLGLLRLLLAIEESFGVSIGEEEMRAATTISALSSIVESRSVAPAHIDIGMGELVQDVLGLAEQPLPDHGPAQIMEWDSLGSLRLLLAIEETFGVSISESEMRSGSSVGALSAIVDRKRGSAAPVDG